MENAVEALKIGFAVLVLVAALSLAIFSFTKVRETTDAITSEKDIKEYYQQLSLGDTGVSSNNALSSRIIGVETIIPTLYRYYKENYTILFYVGYNYNEDTGLFEGENSIVPMTLYYSEASDTYLSKSTLTVSSVSSVEGTSNAIYGFDIQDEQIRREPWSASQETSYNFIKEFINGINGEDGTKYYSSRMANISNRTNENNYGADDNGPYYQLNFKFGTNLSDSNGLVGVGQDYKFVERYGEYNYENVSNTDDTNGYNVISNITDSYDELENGEIVVNNKGTTKRVIQYIFIKSYV